MEQTIRIEQLKELMHEIPKPEPSDKLIDNVIPIDSALDSSFEINEMVAKTLKDPLINTIASEIKRDIDLKRINLKKIKDKMKPIKESKEFKEKLNKIGLPIKPKKVKKKDFRNIRSQTEVVPERQYRKLFFANANEDQNVKEKKSKLSER